jgi:hypothetical protein
MPEESEGEEAREGTIDEPRDAGLGKEHGIGDPARYEPEILPQIQAMSVPQLMNLTGLSQFHCWRVRKGGRRLHARHWEGLTIE